MAQAAAKKPREIEADWDRKATQSAIAAAKDVCKDTSGINARAAIGSLSDIEWGWVCAAAIFGYIKTKAEQAVAESIGYDTAIRTFNHRDPAPWEAGAVATILPVLGEMQGVDWGKPIGEWSKDQITSFAWQIYRLTDSAIAARDEGATDKIVKHLSQPEMEAENSAANGRPLFSRNDDMNDEIPF